MTVDFSLETDEGQKETFFKCWKKKNPISNKNILQELRANQDSLGKKEKERERARGRIYY